MVRIITNDNIKDAVNLWYYDKDEAIKIYGNIIDLWDVSRVTDMSKLFINKSVFNDDISKWDVSNVTDMSGMFSWALSFNQPLNNWNVSNVTNMEGMFGVAESFNQPLNNWDVSNVTNMSGMFWGAESFNQPLNNWDVSNVTNMSGMFWSPTSFNQDLSSWNINYKILGYKPSKNKINVTQLAEFELDKECHICQNTETNNNIIKVNCCNNNYHKDCLIKWLNINKTCPTCRNEF